MSRKANPKLIGAFVVGASALVVAGLLLFGSGRFFTTTRPFVMFFDGSVGGLQVGAPVNFRGVRIGQVVDIRISYDPQSSNLLIPVYAEFERERVVGLTAQKVRPVSELIELGLRAKLGMQSFVTGQLSVELDFLPATPVRLVGRDVGVEELPTLPSDMAQLKASITRVAEQLATLPIDQIVSDVSGAVAAVRETVGTVQGSVEQLAAMVLPIAEDIRLTTAEARQRLSMRDGEVLHTANRTLVAATDAVSKARVLIENANRHVELLSADAQKTLDTTNATMSDARALLDNLDRQVEPLSASARTTMDMASGALQEVRATIQTLNEEAGPLVADARQALQTADRTLSDAHSALEAVGDLAASTKAEVAPLAEHARQTLQVGAEALMQARSAIGDFQELVRDLDGEVRPLADKAQRLLDNASLAMIDARAVMSGARTVIAADAPIMFQVKAALQEIRSAAIAVRDLADYLERNPSALVTGKQ